MLSTRQWIRPVVFETVRKIIACRTPVLGCHLYRCAQCQRLEVVPHSCKSRFCPTCGKHATDRWADAADADAPNLGYRMKLLGWLFTQVTYTCTLCEAVQKIPLRRIHMFEGFMA